LQAHTIDALVTAHLHNEYAATLITSVLDDPTGYGRVIRAPSKTGDGRVLRIVEQRDASAEERAVREVCTSMYAFRRDLLAPALRKLSPDNAQGEYYLTDVIGSLASMGHRIGCVQAPEAETQGVNDRWQLALAERELRSRTNRHWLLNGVTMLDPRQTFVDVTVQLGRDVTLYPGTILQGDTVVGDGCEIGPDTRLSDCRVGDGSVVQHTVGHDSEVGDEARVGPYAYLPSGSSVAPGAVTGAFYTAPAD
ncbi:MAG: bifunctional UDP-N-acetylglucosamine diphosphorylase/glucosamine-1-phosphate N-acetyltransferase GlmU, partial [Actinomycetota bacterium]|nr:bifunctional UDP-N-acetylglucosamine diphosphorylase/glucosamine-1-phosphate N-acetyltransferase GlmU [Actinomycetota bacterium]